MYMRVSRFFLLPVNNLIHNKGLFRAAPSQIDTGGFDAGVARRLDRKAMSPPFSMKFLAKRCRNEWDILPSGQDGSGMQMSLTGSGCQRQKYLVWGGSETEVLFFCIQLPATGMYPPAKRWGYRRVSSYFPLNRCLYIRLWHLVFQKINSLTRTPVAVMNVW